MGKCIDEAQIYVLHALPGDYFVRTDGGAYTRAVSATRARKTRGTRAKPIRRG